MSVLSPLIEQIARKDGRQDANVLSNEIEVLGIQVKASLPGVVGPLFNRLGQGLAGASDKVIGVKLRELSGARGVVTNAGKAGLLGDIEAARDRNIKLVEEAHRVYAKSVRDIIDDPKNFGLRVEEITAQLLARGDVSESRAELIARDQTLKLNGQIAQMRMIRAGVGSYTWSTSGDERVRDEHAALEGQTFTWEGPPDVGHPGQDFQCRCVAVPNLDEAEGLF